MEPQPTFHERNSWNAVSFLPCPGRDGSAGAPCSPPTRDPPRPPRPPAAIPTVPSVTLPADTLKGFGHGGKDALALQQIRSLKLDWHYTWGSHYNVTTSPAFVPMVKSARTLLEQDAIGWVTRQLAETKTKHLLGFNEPDVTAQANMSVDQAISCGPSSRRPGCGSDLLRLQVRRAPGLRTSWRRPRTRGCGSIS